MGELYNRDLYYQIGTVPIQTQLPDRLLDRPQNMLRSSFTVERTLAKEPNIAKLSIWNLNATNRGLLQKAAEMLARPKTAWNFPLTIEAGYVNSRTQVFSGDIQYVDSTREGTDWVTDIEAEDGGKKYKSSRINVSLGPGTTLGSVLSVCAGALGVGLGNSALKFAQAASANRGLSVFKKGVVLSGKAERVLSKYVTSAGYKWSIQDNQLQVLAPDDALLDVAVVLDVTTGLVGSPERGEKGIVKATSLMQGSIKPGRRVLINSDTVTGTFKVETVTHSGDTWGQDWYTTFEGKPITI